MEDLHRERISSNLNMLAEKTQWNCVLEEKLLFYKVFNSKMMEDITKVGIITNMDKDPILVFVEILF